MKRILISGWLLFASIPAGAQDPTSIAQHAVDLQQQGRYAEAANAYADLLKLVPDDVATHVNYGVVLVNLHRYDEAILQYQAAEKLLPQDARIELNLALAYQKSGRWQEARKQLEALHAADPLNSQVTKLLANSYLDSQQDDLVVELLRPLKNSDDPGVAYMLGLALLRTRHPEEAQVYLDRILRSGDTAEVRFLQGIEAYEAGNYPEAAKQFGRTAELNASLPQLQTLWGNSLLYTGDPDGALKAFDLALQANPEDATAALSKAQILNARKRYAEAMPLAREAVRLRPDDPQAKLTLAELLLNTGALREAQGYANEAALSLPKSEQVHRTLASIQRKQGQSSQADLQDRVADELAAEADPGPKTKDPAPDFTLADAATGKPVHLAEYRGRSPVALIFGSYSCPNFRDSADALKEMQERYGAHIPFLLVYVREAHAEDQWQSARNVRSDVSVVPAASMAEKEEHALMCSRKLRLPFPAVVDGMDGAVESAYNAWPSRAYIIGKDGRVVYSTRLSELEFEPARMEAVLRKLATP